MKISIIGAGYVGLVTAAIFSDLGNEVSCVEISEKRLVLLNKGQIPFSEPSLPEFIARNKNKGRLVFTNSYKESIPASDVVFICVGTPPKDNGEADLTYLFNALEETAKNLAKDTIIVIKSTFPIGFENDLEQIVKKHTKINFEFAACPEFLKEGSALEDALNPDRIVIGAATKKAQRVLLELHAPLPGKRIVCDMRSAQLIKYASNSFLATKISFANALANICEKANADIEKVIEGVGADRRIGTSFFKPGIGYGGSCLPKDVLAFIAQASQFDYNFDLLKSVDAINNYQIESFIRKIRQALNAQEDKKANLEGFNLAILGLAFKPNTDDMRDAPSVKIINRLQLLGAKITAFDPQSIENAKLVLKNVDYASDEYEAVKDKDALVVITEWDQFKEMDMEKIKKLLKNPIVIDGRNVYDREKMIRLGYNYTSIGR